jgi:hypothetical protein
MSNSPFGGIVRSQRYSTHRHATPQLCRGLLSTLTPHSRTVPSRFFELNSILLAALLVLSGMFACGDGDDAHDTNGALPTATRTALATATPGSEAVIRYRLTEGSRIFFAPPLPSPTVEEPLSGTFELIPSPPAPPPGPNTAAWFVVSNLEFQGGSQFLVLGGSRPDSDPAFRSGLLHSATTSLPLAFSTSVYLLINGAPIGMSGGGPYDPSPMPTLRDIEICGGAADRAVFCDAIRDRRETGYIITVFAAPTE